MKRPRRTVLAAALAAAAVAAALQPAAAEETAGARAGWKLVAEEGFDDPLRVNDAPWAKDPLGSQSPWHVDDFDDSGKAWQAISNPDFDQQLSTLDVFRKRVPFGTGGWLTAEVAAVDKDKDGRPDSSPGLSGATLPNGERVGQINEPSWDAGVLIRPTKTLPSRYRVEMTLRGIDFGGKRGGSFEYDGKYNGYTQDGQCKTGFPWTFKGAQPGKGRCDYGQVKNENGFYYMTILDYANPAPHGNPGIHYRRKVIMDGYYSNASWSQTSQTCNPKTGVPYNTFEEGNFNGVNALFARGDTFRESGNNNVSTQYFSRTACGDTPEGIMTGAEMQPELLPEAKYTFAVERDATGYTLEYSGPFRHIGQATLRFHHDFVEDGRPIWHYNQKAEDYDGRFDQQLTHTGAAGTYTTEHTWPKGSAYPDSFIIGDPHLNYYEGSAQIDNIRLYIPQD